MENVSFDRNLILIVNEFATNWNNEQVIVLNFLDKILNNNKSSENDLGNILLYFSALIHELPDEFLNEKNISLLDSFVEVAPIKELTKEEKNQITLKLDSLIGKSMEVISNELVFNLRSFIIKESRLSAIKVFVEHELATSCFGEDIMKFFTASLYANVLYCFEKSDSENEPYELFVEHILVKLKSHFLLANLFKIFLDVYSKKTKVQSSDKDFTAIFEEHIKNMHVPKSDLN